MLSSAAVMNKHESSTASRRALVGVPGRVAQASMAVDVSIRQPIA